MRDIYLIHRSDGIPVKELHAWKGLKPFWLFDLGEEPTQPLHKHVVSFGRHSVPQLHVAIHLELGLWWIEAGNYKVMKWLLEGRCYYHLLCFLRVPWALVSFIAKINEIQHFIQVESSSMMPIHNPQYAQVGKVYLVIPHNGFYLHHDQLIYCL